MEEVIRLKHRYKILQSEADSKYERQNAVINKQREVFSDLEKETTEMIYVKRQGEETSASREAEAIHIRKLLHKQDNIQKAVLRHKEKILEQEKQITKLESIIENRRKLINGDGKQQGAITVEQILEKVNVMENRLEEANVKHDKAHCKNTELRKEMDHLLNERAKFNKLHKKLSANIAKGRRIMQTLVNKANETYNEREEFQSTIRVLTDQRKEESKLHQVEEKKMDILRQKEDNTPKFSSQKIVCSTVSDENVFKSKEQTEVKKKITFISEEQYEKDFKEMSIKCGEDNIEEIDQQFFRKEHENFKIFESINDINNEISILKERIGQMKLEANDIEYNENHREKIHEEKLNKLQVNLAESHKKEEEVQNLLSQEEEILQLYVSGLEMMNNRINLELTSSKFHNPPDEINSFNDGNVMQFLELIEARANNLRNIRNHMLENFSSTSDISQFPDRKEMNVTNGITNLAVKSHGDVPNVKRNLLLDGLTRTVKNANRRIPISKNELKTKLLSEQLNNNILIINKE